MNFFKIKKQNIPAFEKDISIEQGYQAEYQNSTQFACHQLMSP